MLATPTRPRPPITAAGPQELLRAIARLYDGAVDLHTALELQNVPTLYAMNAEWLRSRYNDLGALLAQLAAMRAQLGEYVRAAEEDAPSGREAP